MPEPAAVTPELAAFGAQLLEAVVLAENNLQVQQVAAWEAFYADHGDLQPYGPQVAAAMHKGRLLSISEVTLHFYLRPKPSRLRERIRLAWNVLLRPRKMRFEELGGSMVIGRTRQDATDVEVTMRISRDPAGKLQVAVKSTP
jgi:hypothetical protein